MSATHELVLHRWATLEYAEALADGFGAMHARWWGAERLGEIDEAMPSAQAIHRFVDLARPGIAHLRRQYGEEIGLKNLETIEAFFDKHPYHDFISDI